MILAVAVARARVIMRRLSEDGVPLGRWRGFDWWPEFVHEGGERGGFFHVDLTYWAGLSGERQRDRAAS